MQNPTISLGLPVYNGERYLREALDSILGQTYGDFELLIADNASTDGTLEVCREAAREDPRVRVLASATNRGLAWNWNRVLFEAQGRFFRWTCYDDRMGPALLERCLAALTADPQAVASYPATEDIDTDGQLIGPYSGDLDLRDPSPVTRFRQLVGGLARCNMTFALFRTEALRRSAPLGGYPHADQVLLVRAALLGPILQIDEVLFARRVHGDMSLIAHKDAGSLARLYDSSVTHRYFYPYGRLFCEYARSVACSPLSIPDRAACLAFLALEWRFYRTIGGELNVAARQWANARRA